MKKIFLALLAFTTTSLVNAQISVTSSSMTYSQNFNTLDTAAANSSNLPAGWMIKEVGTSATTVNDQYKGGSGTSNSGETFSFGSVGSTDRALGSQSSGSNRPNFGVAFVNNTGVNINSFSVAYTIEQWRVGDSINKKDTTIFSYSTNVSALDSSTLSPWIVDYGLTMNSPVTFVAGLGGTSLDGNLPANRAPRSGTINYTVTPGDTLFIKWSDLNGTGSDDGLAVEDFTISFDTSTTPSAPVLVSFSPADNTPAEPVATNSLSLTFNKAVMAGTGNITLKNITDGSSVTYAASSCAITGNVATVNGVTLLADKDYAVNIDNASFKEATNLFYTGIADNTTWNFHTDFPIAVRSVNILKADVFNGNDEIAIVVPSNNYNYALIDILGNVVLQKNVTASTIRISKNNLTQGVYFLKINSKSETVTLKLLNN
jgi:hypothetical protein